jgi:hypothetical protein
MQDIKDLKHEGGGTMGVHAVDLNELEAVGRALLDSNAGNATYVATSANVPGYGSLPMVARVPVFDSLLQSFILIGRDYEKRIGCSAPSCIWWELRIEVRCHALPAWHYDYSSDAKACRLIYSLIGEQTQFAYPGETGRRRSIYSVDGGVKVLGPPSSKRIRVTPRGVPLVIDNQLVHRSPPGVQPRVVLVAGLCYLRIVNDGDDSWV